MSSAPVICQVAFSAIDARTLLSWYRTAFGFLPAGATVFGGPLATRVQGIERNLSVCRWLVDSQDFFQLEFFGFVSPKTRKRRSDDRLCDLGYRMIGIHVTDFEGTMARLRKLRCLPRMTGETPSRIASVRDPEGNWVEIFESDPLAGPGPDKARPEVNATVRSITLSVSDLGLPDRCGSTGLVYRSPLGSSMGPSTKPCGVSKALVVGPRSSRLGDCFSSSWSTSGRSRARIRRTTEFRIKAS
jgi:catechol 2,3-dioxygenase-like lactoylglutathione lyase family enzyme